MLFVVVGVAYGIGYGVIGDKARGHNSGGSDSGAVCVSVFFSGSRRFVCRLLANRLGKLLAVEAPFGAGLGTYHAPLPLGVGGVCPLSSAGV